MSEPISKRDFLRTLSGGTLLAAAYPALAADTPQEAPPPAPKEAAPGPREVRLERLRPHEIEQAMQACPVLFQPLGTIEWHGLHNLVGLDAIKAHHLCV